MIFIRRFNYTSEPFIRVSLDSAAAADPVNMNTTATGHRTIGHHTTDRHPIGHHADTSAMGGGSWGAGNMGSKSTTTEKFFSKYFV